jgi:hypothetical protein
MIGRLAFNKLNRAVARDENARIREEKQAAEQEFYDEQREQFISWSRLQGEDHPLVTETALECEKINNNLTWSQGVKTRRYNSLFANAWQAAQITYGATASDDATTEVPRRSPSELKVKVCRVIAAFIVGFVLLAIFGPSSPNSSKNGAQAAAPEPTTISVPEPKSSPAPTPADDLVPVKKAMPVEVRKAIPVKQNKAMPIEVRKAIPVGQNQPAKSKENDFMDRDPLEETDFVTHEEENLRYTISSTGKRHNSTCRFYGKGRSASKKEGIACKVCGG